MDGARMLAHDIRGGLDNSLMELFEAVPVWVVHNGGASTTFAATSETCSATSS